MNADGTLSGAKLIGFLRENRDSLRELFLHDQVSIMGAVARDAEAGARWRTTTAIKGGSDTVKNMLSSLGGKAGEAAKHVSRTYRFKRCARTILRTHSRRSTRGTQSTT